jgi:hypothetical protein
MSIQYSTGQLTSILHLSLASDGDALSPLLWLAWFASTIYSVVYKYDGGQTGLPETHSPCLLRMRNYLRCAMST